MTDPRLADAPALSWSADEHGAVDALGGPWLRVTGRAPETLLGDGWMDVVHPEDVPRVAGIRRTSRDAGIGYALDLRLCLRDGSHRWWLDRAEPSPDAPRRFAGSMLDIHDRRQDEDDLARRARSLRLAERRQGQFMARLAHELRAPLAPIGNAANVLRTVEHTNPILLRLREILDRQVARLGRMVEALIDTTRVAHGQVSLVREATSVERVVQAAAARAAGAVEARGHTLRLLPGDGPHPIDGDVERLIQALANLLDNAARHSPDGSTITVEPRRVARTVQIRVQDNGRGLDAGFLPHAFELFSTEERADVPSAGGLGLGLPFARRIAQLHGGDVEGASEGKGRGAEFVLWLPLADRTAAVPAAAAPTGHARLAESFRVLVVEDDDDARDSLALQMKVWGNEVETAATAAEALAKTRAWQPQIVLCDLALPDVDGCRLVGPLRKASAPGTLFAAVTGYATTDDQRRATGAGFDSFLVKPIDAESLVRLLRSAASREDSGAGSTSAAA